jgi:RNA polymerase sigma factor (TIGR02999 family)
MQPLPVSETPPDVTLLLQSVQHGQEGAFDQLLPLVYNDLRQVAAKYLRAERMDHTLQPTALVHETFLRLVDQRSANWQNRAHFFAVAAQLMRRVLVDYARRVATAKRGGGRIVSLEEDMDVPTDEPEVLLDVDEALTALAKMDPRAARVVELRFYAGLSVDEVAEVMQLSTATIKREWASARAWLEAELQRSAA